MAATGMPGGGAEGGGLGGLGGLSSRRRRRGRGRRPRLALSREAAAAQRRVPSSGLVPAAERRRVAPLRVAAQDLLHERLEPCAFDARIHARRPLGGGQEAPLVRVGEGEAPPLERALRLAREPLERDGFAAEQPGAQVLAHGGRARRRAELGEGQARLVSAHVSVDGEGRCTPRGAREGGGQPHGGGAAVGEQRAGGQGRPNAEVDGRRRRSDACLRRRLVLRLALGHAGEAEPRGCLRGDEQLLLGARRRHVQAVDLLREGEAERRQQALGLANQLESAPMPASLLHERLLRRLGGLGHAQPARNVVVAQVDLLPAEPLGPMRRREDERRAVTLEDRRLLERANVLLERGTVALHEADGVRVLDAVVASLLDGLLKRLVPSAVAVLRKPLDKVGLVGDLVPVAELESNHLLALLKPRGAAVVSQELEAVGGRAAVLQHRQRLAEERLVEPREHNELPAAIRASRAARLDAERRRGVRVAANGKVGVPAALVVLHKRRGRVGEWRPVPPRLRERPVRDRGKPLERARVPRPAELVDALVGVVHDELGAARALDDGDLRGGAVVRLV
mmetsp:Transcript_35743/g.114426  ORF Transcript_35743/g.114426 Transcript_35743/m.114426 type:complete len:567 (+) Transcript_35743:548-2248(+)